MHILFVTLTLLAGLITATQGSAMVVDPDIAFLLRARRAWPNLVPEAARLGIDLLKTADVRTQLARSDLLAAERRYQTVVIDPAGEVPMKSAPGDDEALVELGVQLKPFVRTFSPDPSLRREQLACRIHGLIQSRGLDRRHAVDLVRFAAWSMDVENVAHRVNHLEAEDLELFRNPVFLKARLGRLKRELGASRRRQREVVNLIDRVHQDLRPVRVATPGPREPLTLAEMHPDLASLKGLPGRDCSTRYCFGGPYAPSERTFAILDSRDKLRGYVGLSRTVIDGRATYYINTINGPRLNAEHTLMVVAGVKALLDSEVTQLSLPAPYRLKQFINFRVVRYALAELITSERPRAQDFTDVAARRLIESHSNSTYERMGENDTARIIPKHLLDQIKYPTRVSEGSRFAELDQTEPFELEYNATVVEALCSHDILADVMWYRAGRSDDDLANMYATVFNEEFEDVGTFYDRVSRMLSELGFPRPAEFIHDQEALFVVGRIVAAGSMAPSARGRTIEALLKYVGSRHERIENSPIRRWLKTLASDAKDDLIVAVARALYAVVIKDKPTRNVYQLQPEDHYAELLADLVSHDQLIQHAPRLATLGLHWGELTEASAYLAAHEAGSKIATATLRTRDMVNAAINAAPDAHALAERARQILSAPAGSTLYDHVGHWLTRFVALNPRPEDIEVLVSGVREPGTVRAIIGWLSEPPPAHAHQLLIALRRHFTSPLGVNDRKLLAPHLGRLMDHIFRDTPDPSDLGQLQYQFIQEDSGLYDIFIHRAVESLGDLRDLPRLIRGEWSAERAIKVSRHLKPRFERLTPGEKKTVLDVYERRLPGLAATFTDVIVIDNLSCDDQLNEPRKKPRP